MCNVAFGFFHFLELIQPVTLPSSDGIVNAGVTVTVSGFGKTSDDPNEGASQRLNYVELTTITNEQCASVYGDSAIDSYIICAIGNPHHSPCSVST